MLLTIDIGNSSTKFGFFNKSKLIKKITIPTIRDETAESIYAQINDQISDRISAIVISTVVKESKNTYRILGENYFYLEPFFADHTFDFGFSVNYFPAENCGSDRLVDAFAAVRKFGSPIIVCDFGTATTIDVVNQKNEYLGGIITPGPNTLGSALFEKTSQLPKVEFEKPDNIIGNSTVSSIQSGIYFGYIGLVDGIIERMIKKLDDQPRIISTGGFAKLIAEESKYVDIIEENLMLEGLRLIHQKQKDR
jgi:type III pantothenate kinase